MTKARIIAALLFLACIAAKAQDTTLKLSPVTVETGYVPHLSDAVKEPTVPVADKPAAELPKLSYAIIPVQFTITSRLDIPQALQMGPNSVPMLKNNLVKLGFGNYASPLAEIYLHNLRSKYASYGATFKHLSVSGPNDAKFSDYNFALFGKRFFKKGTLGAAFDYKRNALRYYGLDRAENRPADDSLKQVFNTFALDSWYETKEWGKAKSRFTTGFSFYNISDKWETQETDAAVFGNFITHIKKDELKINLAYNFTNYTDTGFSLTRHFVNIAPRYGFEGKKWKLGLGFNSTIYIDTASPVFYFFPAIDGSYEIEKESLTAIGGISGNLQKNTYRGFVLENPFINNRIQLNNTVNRLELYAGIKGKTSANFGFLARIFLNRYNDMAVYIADTTVLRRFKPLYIDARVFRFNAELSYQYSEKVRLNLAANLYNYDVIDSAQEAWQLPTAELKFNATYNIGNKLLFSADIFLMNRRPVITEYRPASSIGAFADFNFAAEYRYRKTLSFFVRLNNISSVRYQRWYNYPVLGLNAHAGITFSL